MEEGARPALEEEEEEEGGRKARACRKKIWRRSS